MFRKIICNKKMFDMHLTHLFVPLFFLQQRTDDIAKHQMWTRDILTRLQSFTKRECHVQKLRKENVLIDQHWLVCQYLNILSLVKQLEATMDAPFRQEVNYIKYKKNKLQ